MLFNILEDTGSGADTAAQASNPWMTWVILGIFALVFIVFMIFNNRSNKKREKEAQDTLNAIKPGNKVKTVGGVCGIVVEVCPEDDTFVLETGTQASGKSYIKFDKRAIYQTDAVAEKPAAKKEEKPVEEKVEEKTEEKPVEETKTEA